MRTSALAGLTCVVRHSLSSSATSLPRFLSFLRYVKPPLAFRHIQTLDAVTEEDVIHPFSPTRRKLDRALRKH